uniref:Structural maintenance of chromosomes 1B n=1 Tax=Cyprinus carpio TaxID=7962 RepID=A0A8C1SPS3_CYPCA
MGFLKQLDVENFKSWRGKQTIGPFKRFNCIIGTNGSGKSNVMDALGFVMGERAVNLRVKHTRDLIHGAHIGKPSSTFASVSMIYCGDNDEEIIFSRRISGESSEYRVNGRQVTLAKYTGELEKIGIVVKAKNCLVYQVLQCSGELSAEYDAKLVALQKAKEDTQFHFNRKKAATAEKKQVFKDKTEAEKYQALVDEHREDKLQLTLFQLFHNEKKIDAQSESLRDMQDAAAQQKNSLDVYEQTVKGQKKEHGRMNRELQQLEKEIRFESPRPQYIKAKVNTSHHEQKVEEARRSLQKNQSQQAKKEQELQELRSELAELEKTWKASERQLEEEAAQRGDGVQLEEYQMERYKELKELARKKGAVLNQSAEKLHWEVKADCEKLQFDLRRKSEIQANIKHTQTRLEDFSRRAEKLEEKGLEEQRQQEEQLAEELARGRVRMEEVNEELAQVLTKLQNARLDSQENRRQQRRDEVLESLRRLYPDTVYGRLVDLCQPIHKKYQVAVTKVFGKNMNAIVVTSAKVAHDCIRFLKEERAEPETFLPIDYIDVRPLNERLREVQGAKLVVDVVQCAQSAPQLKRVIQYVCGNSLVCETLKDARRIAFDGPERLQTVALDGTLFRKSGVISGGSLDLRSKARRWEEKDMNKLKEEKDQLSSELRALMKLKRKEVDLKQIMAQSQGNQTRLKYSNSELDSIRKKSIPACQASHWTISRIYLEPRAKVLVKLQKETICTEAALEQLRLSKHNLLLSCKIDGLPLTLISGALDDISDIQVRTEGQIYLKQGSTDYSLLLFCYSAVKCTQTLLQLDSESQSVTLEKIREVKDSFRETSTHTTKKCSQEFEQVKSKRFHLFSQCFEHVSVVIDQIYKKLCRNASAQAILSAENPNEPYLDGINYNCVAPGKRFMAMDNLSGGEKAIAALALVFAIHSFRPAPFFVLDEVDAALDNTNIGKVTGFFRMMSRESCQIIVISLKEEFYSRADALLGVYSMFDECMFSRLLTLDLTPYPLNEETATDREKDK